MLIITGPGRCGSTLLAAYCKMMGHDPGGTGGPGVEAGFEDPEVCRINSLIKRGQGEEVGVRIQALSRGVVKDPRFITFNCPDIIQIWAESRADLRILLLQRDLELVARSFAARPEQFERTDIPEMIADLTRSLGAFEEAVREKNLPCHRLELLRKDVHFDEVAEALESFGGLKLNPDAAVIESFGLKVSRLTPRSVWREWFDPRRIHWAPQA